MGSFYLLLALLWPPGALAATTGSVESGKLLDAASFHQRILAISPITVDTDDGAAKAVQPEFLYN